MCLTQLAQTEVPNTAPIRFKDLAQFPLVMSRPKYDLRRRTERLARENGIPLDVRYEQDSPEVMMGVVMAGLAAMTTQVSIFHPTMERPLLDIRPIVEPRVRRTHRLCRLADQALTQAEAALEVELVASLEDLTQNAVLPGQVIQAAPWSDRTDLSAGAHSLP